MKGILKQLLIYLLFSIPGHCLLGQSVSSMDKFTTIYPKTDQILLGEVFFSWNAKEDASSYDFELSTDSSFNTFTINQQSIEALDFKANIIGSSNYYWRVIAKNGSINMDTTNVSKFIVFSPTSIDSLSLWLIGDSVGLSTLSRVSTWYDLSDTMNTLMQGNAARQPDFIPNYINGYGVVDFPDSRPSVFTTVSNIPGKNYYVSSVYNWHGVLGAPTRFINSQTAGNLWNLGPDNVHSLSQQTGIVGPGLGIEQNRFVLNTAYAAGDSVSNIINGILVGKAQTARVPQTLRISIGNGEKMNGAVAEIITYSGLISKNDQEKVDNYLMDKYAPPINLGPNRVLCNLPDSINLVNDYIVNYSWSSGDTTSSILFDTVGLYILNATDIFGRISTDSILIIQDTIDFAVNFNADTIINCEGQLVTLISNLSKSRFSYLWSTGDTTPSINVSQSGNYKLTLQNCVNKLSSDSVQVIFYKPLFSLGQDTSGCHNNFVQLAPDSNFFSVNYLWSSGENTSSIIADTAGQYILTVTDQYGCSFVDSINVSIDSSLIGLTLGNDTSLCSGNEIALINPTSSISSYLWSNGSVNATTIVDTTGIYTVQASNGSCIVSDTINVTIKGDAPVANFLFNNLCFRDSTSFLDTSLPAMASDTVVNWSWKFGSGDSSLLQNPKYSYSQRSAYRVSLEIETDKGCSDTTSKIIEIEPLPNANFGFQDNVICSKSRIFHEDSSSISRGLITGYKWSFGDVVSNQNTSQLRNPFHTYDTLGNYNVELKIISDQGCLDSITKTVYVNPTPFVNFGFSGSCISDSIQFFDSTHLPVANIRDYRWTLVKSGVGSFLVDERQDPLFKINSGGEYIVTLRVRSEVNITESCQGSKRDTISFYESPVALFTVPVICENDSFSVINNTFSNDPIIHYRYVLNQTDTLRFEQPKFEGREPGSYKLELLVESDKNCTDTTSKNVSIYEKPKVAFDILNNNTGIPFSLDLSNNSTNANNYVWSSGDGDSSNAVVPNFRYENKGSYRLSLTATSAIGCTDSTQEQVNALVKYVDANLLKVFLSENNLGDIQVSMQINNSGFNTIDEIVMVVDLNNEFEFRETFKREIYSGRNDGFTFASAFIPDAGKKVDFVCVRILTVNNEQDSIKANNERCELGFNDELILNVFPNPVETNLNLQYTLPDEGNLELKFFDILGREMGIFINGFQQEGFYTSVINLSSFDRGLYIYRFTFNGIEKTGKILVE
ncbi:MAG: PKD repeat protein [Vicingaceae bacterium]|jgi:PKD repeat protein